MKKVNSSNIDSIAYDPRTQILKVTFQAGATYHYHDVPPSAYTSFESAKSQGKHFAQFIKNKYKTKKT